MTFALPFPTIDPVLIEIGPLAVRWYGLAYVAGLILAWRYVRRLAGGPPEVTTARDVDDFLVWATLGVILGGRLGYVLFYKPVYFLYDPLEIFKMWHGGMSFHGGLLGVVVATLWFVRKRKIELLAFSDVIACAAPIGLFFGRLANFINGELYGRATDLPWGIVFPGRDAGPLPRHPSQLYEAGLEGILLFTLLYLLWRIEGVRRRRGVLVGVFLTGYALSRMLVELVRQPDDHIGFLLGGSTMGQWLSLPMLAIGVWMILRAPRRGS